MMMHNNRRRTVLLYTPIDRNMAKLSLIRRLFLLPTLVVPIFQWQCTTTALLNKNNNNNGGKQLSSPPPPWQNVWSKVVGKGALPKEEPLTPEERRGIVLRRLNITSSVEPKAFSIEPSAIPAVLGASIPAALRLGTGAFAEGYKIELGDEDSTKYTLFAIGGKQLVESSQLLKPSRINTNIVQPLMLYDLEGSPSCRLVREACSILSLEVLIRPCPEKGLQFASALRKSGELENLPILDDPNTGITGFKKDTMAILNYLFKTYGNGELPWTMKQEGFGKASSLFAMASRFGSGSRYDTSDPPPLPLTLWSYESSPFCKRVTERLGSLELEHRVIYCPRGSPNRQKLFDLTGRFQVPYLKDPNTGVDLWESSAICEYLTKQYALKTSVAYL